MHPSGKRQEPLSTLAESLKLHAIGSVQPSISISSQMPFAFASFKHCPLQSSNGLAYVQEPVSLKLQANGSSQVTTWVKRAVTSSWVRTRFQKPKSSSPPTKYSNPAHEPKRKTVPKAKVILATPDIGESITNNPST